MRHLPLKSHPIEHFIFVTFALKILVIKSWAYIKTKKIGLIFFALRWLI